MKRKKQRRFLMSIAVLLMLLAGAFYSFQQLGNTQSSASSQTTSSTSLSSNLGIPTTSSTIKAYLKVASSLNSGNAVIEKTISEGFKLVGISPYVYGGGRTDASVAKNEYDCSSFVAQMFRLGGQSLVYQYAASTTLLAQTGNSVSWSNKARGDLLVTAADATENEQHVAIYLGDGYILHDSNSTDGVNISKLTDVINPSVLGDMTWQQLFEAGVVRREV
ncbi:MULTISPECIES: C40 family peptidase [unclassified Lactococcus]|uniref:C40 family peptidase n=1 Tax=unclassified Lactococcus TaxID=2643510 RepID=UPI001E34129C|nr:MULTISPECIES: NlpC/P60 family protein [unclassified Lactococcus]